MHQAALERVQAEYNRPDSGHWVLGFSGGKDSSALLRVAYTAVATTNTTRRPITVVYCDTGVDIPVVTTLVRRTLRLLSKEAAADRLPISVRVARPRLDDRYFVKVIGRGYPPPSNKFRWCTDRLRILPVQRVVRTLGQDAPATILLGVRKSESAERDRTIARHRLDDPYRLRQSGIAGASVFAPLLDYDTPAIWSALSHFKLPQSIDAAELEALYRDAGAECPVVRDPRGTPCGVGRFGCWTCTVVRRDRALGSMISEGHDRLVPLYRFRNWLQDIRDYPKYRCRLRRNGAPGPGPFTLHARHLILRRVLKAQTSSRWPLITRREITRIRELWREDSQSRAYRRLERLRTG